MSMSEWARNEVELAKKFERGDKPETEWDYGCACYDSALKAYLSLIEDDHSGYSWETTKSILIKLLNNIPLRPIEDTPDVWRKIEPNPEGSVTYQCLRKYSLFKTVDAEGNVSYHDVDRVRCRHIDTDLISHFGFVSNIINKMFPITFPYMPPKEPYIVEIEEFLADAKQYDEGWFDTLGIYWLKKDGETIIINQWYKETTDGWAAISFEEYNERKEHARELEKKAKEEPNDG